MSESIRIRIEEQSQTADARRTARGMAAKMGCDETRAEQVAIVVTEVCTNLLKHAHGGELLLRVTNDSVAGDDSEGVPCLELLALDKGPGISNLEQCLRDGFSTVGSAGEGLGAITRLSSSTDFYSEGGKGTAVLARWSTAPVKALPPKRSSAGLHIGAVNVCMPGEEVCGDAWGTEQTEDYSIFMMADGLGHGTEARIAATEALRMLHLNPGLSPALLVERTHQALRSSRGAAVAVARIDRIGGTLTFSGIGNISAQIYSGASASKSLISVHGTAGFQTQRIREFQYPWPENGMLLMFSDGLGSHTSVAGYPGLALRDPTLIAGVLYRDFARGNDDATAMVAKAG